MSRIVPHTTLHFCGSTLHFCGSTLHFCRVLPFALFVMLLCAAGVHAQTVTFAEIEPNNSFSTAQNVGLLPALSGSRITVNGSRVGDDSADFFRFFLDAGRTITLATNPLPGIDPFDTDTVLGLFDPTGVQVAFDDDGGAGFTSFIMPYTASTSGFFRAAVSGFGDNMFMGGGSAGFDYELVIEGQDAAPTVAAIPEPTTLLLLGISLAGVGVVAQNRKRKGTVNDDSQCP